LERLPTLINIGDTASITDVRTKEKTGMAFPTKRNTSHDHTFVFQNVGADLQRCICGECGHVSIHPTPPASLRSEVTVEKTGLFVGGPELVYELAEALTLLPATDPHRPRFGERREAKRGD
jgi:hypothetical protein